VVAGCQKGWVTSAWQSSLTPDLATKSRCRTEEELCAPCHLHATALDLARCPGLRNLPEVTKLLRWTSHIMSLDLTSLIWTQKEWAGCSLILVRWVMLQDN
jgi:hypothetical protein